MAYSAKGTGRPLEKVFGPQGPKNSMNRELWKRIFLGNKNVDLKSMHPMVRVSTSFGTPNLGYFGSPALYSASAHVLANCCKYLRMVLL